MNSAELQKLLKSHGVVLEPRKSGGGHLIAKLGDKVTDVPVHGGSKELGTGLVNAILKQLGLK